MRILLSLSLLLSISPIAHATENWPQWRGPDRVSLAKPGEYPTEFSAEKNVLWKTELPGVGSSTPIVWGDRIFVTSGIDGDDGITAYDWNGEIVWQETLGTERPGKHKNGSGSNPSPITDGKQLVVYYKSGTVASFTLDGELRWKTNLQERYGEDTLWWDLGTSPIFADGKIVIAVMQEGDSYVVALDPKDGSEVWKVDRTFPVQKETGHLFCLGEKSIDHEWLLTEGGHSWPVWRGYLADFAPRLFREGK